MEESPKKILMAVVVIVIIAVLLIFLFLSYMRQLQLASEQRDRSDAQITASLPD